MNIKKTITLFLAFIAVSTYAQHSSTLEKISWYGQAAIGISHDGKQIYIDPFQMPSLARADLVLITHEHGDHLSLPDIAKVADKETIIVCPYDCKAVLAEEGYEEIIAVSPGDIVTAAGIKVEAVPMYNIIKTQFHPQENNWTGFIVDIGDSRVYHAGDTERIPEMKNLKCDIALLPLGQTYTMNSVAEASEAALDTRAEIVIPIHYGMYEGSKEDAKELKRLLRDKIEVVILDPIK